MNWFRDAFGFKEQSYEKTRSRFDYDEKELVLTSKANGRKFYVGHFETPSMGELMDKVTKCEANVGSKATFEHLSGNAMTLHRDSSNQGSVFQVASQFNCLEMVGPNVRPTDGITRYASDRTQGPACAISCPAGTLYRNYFYGGEGQAKKQINTLDVIQKILSVKYWDMQNGYAMPCGRGKGMVELNKRLESSSELETKLMNALKIGVHWNTEVESRVTKENHRVCQVFSSACPVAYSKYTKSTDWAPFANLVLRATYIATLSVGALIAKRENRRVKVFLTAVGGGAFGNRTLWIVDALSSAMKIFRDAPIDVFLVHYGPKGAKVNPGLFGNVGKVLNEKKKKKKKKKCSGEVDLCKMLSSLEATKHDGSYAFCTVKKSSDSVKLVAELLKNDHLEMFFKEREGYTLILSPEIAQKYEIKFEYVASWIELKIHSSLEAVGLTAAFSRALTNANVSANVVAGYYHDHIFVAEKDADLALDALNKLSQDSMVLGKGDSCSK
jgi:hypothetical protein